MFNLFVTFLSAFFSLFFGVAYAQDEPAEVVSQNVQLTIKWPDADLTNLFVAVLQNGGNCPATLTGQPEDMDTYGQITWFNHVNGGAVVPASISDYFTICTYQRTPGGGYNYVPTSLALDIAQRPTYEYTVVLPKSVVPEKLTLRRERHPVPQPQGYDPTTTTYLGTLVYPGWSRLGVLGAFVAEPRSVQFKTHLGHYIYRFNPVLMGGFTRDLTGDSMRLVPDLGVGGMVGGDIYYSQSLTVSGEAGLMLGYGPSIWGCQSNSVMDGSNLQLSCSSGSDTDITLRTQAPWLGLTMQVSVDLLVVGNTHLGLGLWTQLRLIDASLFLPDLSQQTTSVVGSDGQQYQAHYRVMDGFTFVVPIVPTVKLTWE